MKEINEIILPGKEKQTIARSWLLMCGFIAQLVEHRTGICGYR